MKKPAIIGGALFLLVVIIIIWIVSSYNGILTKEQSVDHAWGNVESQYQRRKDLIPNLERSVKAYTKHEGETYIAVTKARSQAADRFAEADEAATGMAPDSQASLNRYSDAQANAARALDVYVNAVKEAYPDLQSSENFRMFQTQLEGTENRIQNAREEYNTQVKEYNVAVRRFPAVMISGIMGFGKRPMFQAEAGASRAPQVFEE